MLLGFKTELKLNNQQRSLLSQHAGTARHAWNWGLALTKQILDHNKANPNDKIKFPTAIDLHQWLVALVKPENQWYYDPEDLKQLITSKTKLIVINFPHNPTGYSLTPAEFKQITEIAQQNNILLFSDEMYRFLHHDTDQQLPSACDLYENAISLWGTAKTFGLAGLRLGWLTSKNKEILKKVEHFKDYLSICNSATSELLGTIAINNMAKFVNPNLEKIKSNILLFEQFHHRNADFFDFIKLFT